MLLLRPVLPAPPAAVARLAARALVGSDDREVDPVTLPPWLAEHQVPAARRILAILARYRGALLADAVGLGKSYVALAVAVARNEPFVLVVPSVLEAQWRALLDRMRLDVPVITHEALSGNAIGPSARAPFRLCIVDEAHRFRHRDTRRYRALAKLVATARVLLVTATPVHNRIADLFRLFHLFLRDDALTGLGIPSLHGAARGTTAPEVLRPVVARLTVARSRGGVLSRYGRRGSAGGPTLRFPARAPGRTLAAAPLPDHMLEPLVEAIGRLRGPGEAGALFRLVLLTRLASSIPAFRESLRRYEAFLELAGEAARDGRRLAAQDFARLFPDRDIAALQLPLFPILLEPGAGELDERDVLAIAGVRDVCPDAADPKVALLQELLRETRRKTIVFTGARATARYLAQRLASERVATVLGDRGLLAASRVSRREVLQWFAPQSQGAAPPPRALQANVLITTDLLSEGMNLQDAARVIHYDLPWSPARLAQRVGRIDRLGSPHDSIETVTFVPPPPLARALRLEERHAQKARTLAVAGAEIETIGGREESGALEWCDRLDALPHAPLPPVPHGAWATIAGTGRESAVVLVVQVGALVEAVVVDESGARADPRGAAAWLEWAAGTEGLHPDRVVVERAIGRAAPLIRARLAAMADARWRAGDRDRLGRRLIPWVLTAARKAARRGDAVALGRLDALVSRLAAGMTAGEELLLEDLVLRRAPLAVEDLLAWDARLQPLAYPAEHLHAELVAAIVVVPAPARLPSVAAEQ